MHALAPFDSQYEIEAHQEAATVSVIDPIGDTVVATVDLRELGFTEKSKPHDTAVERQSLLVPAASVLEVG